MSKENEHEDMMQNETEELVAEQEPQNENEEKENGAPEVSQVKLESFGKENSASTTRNRLDLLMDIVLPVSIELGRTKLYVKDILELERGSIIELDKMAGEPVDLFINSKKMAEGEVVVVDKHFGIRITHLIDPEDRIKNLGKEF